MCLYTSNSCKQEHFWEACYSYEMISVCKHCFSHKCIKLLYKKESGSQIILKNPIQQRKLSTMLKKKKKQKLLENNFVLFSLSNQYFAFDFFYKLICFLFFCLLSLSVFVPFFSIIAALQVSISLNKVELSVGESKFFICTGTNATHYVFPCGCTQCVCVWRLVRYAAGDLTSALVKSVCCWYDSEHHTIHIVHMVSDSLTPWWLDPHSGCACPSRPFSSLSSLNSISTLNHNREHNAGASSSVGWQHTLAGPAHLLLAASSLLPSHSAWS